jgi:hypothetical protein
VNKGEDISFNLLGSVSNELTLKNVHIHVEWNNSPLYDEDNEASNIYDSDIEYHLKWNIPSFAPSGHYDVHVIGTGDA